MAVDDPNCIDIIATRPGSNEVRLVIADHLDWSDAAAHWALLQEKLNGYVGFIESGQFSQAAHRPLPATPEFCIEVRALYPAPPEFEAVFQQVAAVVAPLGIQFRHVVGAPSV